MGDSPGSLQGLAEHWVPTQVYLSFEAVFHYGTLRNILGISEAAVVQSNSLHQEHKCMSALQEIPGLPSGLEPVRNTQRPDISPQIRVVDQVYGESLLLHRELGSLGARLFGLVLPVIALFSEDLLSRQISQPKNSEEISFLKAKK